MILDYVTEEAGNIWKELLLTYPKTGWAKPIPLNCRDYYYDFLNSESNCQIPAKGISMMIFMELHEKWGNCKIMKVLPN